MSATLRPYQTQAKAAVRSDFVKGHRRVAVVLPTGTGKTVIFSSMAYDTYAKGNRVIVLVHRDTLVGQAYKKLVAAGIPEGHIGIVKASKNEVDAPVIVASIHTLRNPERMRQITPPALTIVDEAHVSVSPTYHAYYQHIAAYGGSTFIVGFTATMMRNDRNGLGDVYERVSFKRSIKWAVNNGYLVRPEAIQYGPAGEGSKPNVDTSGCRTIGGNPDSASYGDYNEHDLQELVMVDDLLDTVVKGYHELAAGQPAVLFAPTQASARYFLAGLAESGVPVAEVMAGTTAAARQWAFAAFDAGSTHVLGTCTALAEGWDCPRCSVALMVRPTRSPLMFIQQVGRILRPWPGKRRGLVLDFVGVTDDQTMACAVDLSLTPEVREVDYPCQECGRELCVDCGGCRMDRCSYTSCTCEQEAYDFDRVPIPHTAKKITGVTEVDLFAGTDARWLMTNKGVPFVRTRDYTFFVAFHEGAYAVGRCGASSSQGGIWLAKGLASDDALEQGSEAALADDPTVANKKSSWRQGNQPASPQQQDHARRIGIDPTGMGKAELSDAISIRTASRLLAGIGSN